MPSRTSVELDADRTIVISRTFRAPPHIVFDAWTKAELVKRWWAPTSFGVTMVSCEADVREGGRFRYVIRPGGGEEIGFSGKYVEVTPHSRLVYTLLYEPAAQAGEMVVTVTFEARDGKTYLVSREVYPSAEAREAALASGMEPGIHATMDQLDELVASLA